MLNVKQGSSEYQLLKVFGLTQPLDQAPVLVDKVLNKITPLI